MVSVHRVRETVTRIEAVREAAVKKAQASLDAWHAKHRRDNREHGDFASAALLRRSSCVRQTNCLPHFGNHSYSVATTPQDELPVLRHYLVGSTPNEPGQSCELTILESVSGCSATGAWYLGRLRPERFLAPLFFRRTCTPYLCCGIETLSLSSCFQHLDNSTQRGS